MPRITLWAASRSSDIPVSGSIQAETKITSNVLLATASLHLHSWAGWVQEALAQTRCVGWLACARPLSEPHPSLVPQARMGQKYPYLCSDIHIRAEREDWARRPCLGPRLVTAGCSGLGLGGLRQRLFENPLCKYPREKPFEHLP